MLGYAAHSRTAPAPLEAREATAIQRRQSDIAIWLCPTAMDGQPLRKSSQACASLATLSRWLCSGVGAGLRRTVAAQMMLGIRRAQAPSTK